MERDLTILYEDEKMIVCNKPSGVLAQSNRTFDVDMVSAIMTYRRKKGEAPFVGVINRLDRQVSGLMVFGKTSAETARLNRLMQQNTFHKQYYAVICGKPEDDQGTFVDYMLKDGKDNTSSIVLESVKGSKRAELKYEVIATKTGEELDLGDADDRYSLVKIHLITGRHHQIRVQFASRGLVLLGDLKYVSNNDMMVHKVKLSDKSIALCAYSLDLEKKHFEIIPRGVGFNYFSREIQE